MIKILFYPLRPLIALLCYTAFQATQIGAQFTGGNVVEIYAYRARLYSPVYWVLCLIVFTGMAALFQGVGIVETYRQIVNDTKGNMSLMWRETHIPITNSGRDNAPFQKFIKIYCP